MSRARIDAVGRIFFTFTGTDANIMKSGRRIKEVWWIVRRFKDFWRGSSRSDRISLSVGKVCMGFDIDQQARLRT